VQTPGSPGNWLGRGCGAYLEDWHTHATEPQGPPSPPASVVQSPPARRLAVPDGAVGPSVAARSPVAGIARVDRAPGALVRHLPRAAVARRVRRPALVAAVAARGLSAATRGLRARGALRRNGRGACVPVASADAGLRLVGPRPVGADDRRSSVAARALAPAVVARRAVHEARRAPGRLRRGTACAGVAAATVASRTGSERQPDARGQGERNRQR
jgi:hypothetical protein